MRKDWKTQNGSEDLRINALKRNYPWKGMKTKALKVEVEETYSKEKASYKGRMNILIHILYRPRSELKPINAAMMRLQSAMICGWSNLIKHGF